MPELPEVETVRRGLEKYIVGRTIYSVNILDKGETLVKNVDNDQFCDLLAGEFVDNIDRHGKYLIFRLSNFNMTIHFAMFGSLTYNYHHPQPRILFVFNDATYMTYNDTRNWGRISLYPKNSLLLEGLGIDAISPNLTFDVIKELIEKSPKTPLHEFLVDQNKIAGIGNIYRSEIMWHQQLHPDIPVGAMLIANAFNASSDYRMLHTYINLVLQGSIQRRGTSIADYIDADGNPGQNQLNLMVYNRHDLPCRRCHKTIVRESRDSRSVFFCPNCQRPLKM